MKTTHSLLSLCVLLSHVATAVDAITYVRVCLAQARAERASLPDLPENDDDTGIGQGAAELPELPPIESEVEVQPVEALPIPPELLRRFGEALEEAAEQSDDPVQSFLQEEDHGTQVLLFGGASCIWCDEADGMADKIEAAGWIVRHISDDEQPDISRAFGIEKLPTWILVKDHAEVERLLGPCDVPERGRDELYAALDRVNTMPQVSGAIGGPILKAGQLLVPYLGRTIELGESARLVVPRGLTWSTTNTSAGCRMLFGSVKPHAEVDRLVTWQATVEGIEVQPHAIIILLDNLPDITLTLDWSQAVHAVPPRSIRATAQLTQAL